MEHQDYSDPADHGEYRDEHYGGAVAVAVEERPVEPVATPPELGPTGPDPGRICRSRDRGRRPAPHW